MLRRVRLLACLTKHIIALVIAPRDPLEEVLFLPVIEAVFRFGLENPLKSVGVPPSFTQSSSFHSEILGQVGQPVPQGLLYLDLGPPLTKQLSQVGRGDPVQTMYVPLWSCKVLVVRSCHPTVLTALISPWAGPRASQSMGCQLSLA